MAVVQKLLVRALRTVRNNNELIIPEFDVVHLYFIPPDRAICPHIFVQYIVLARYIVVPV